MQYEEIIKKIKSLHNPEAVAGMTRFGINPENTYGVSIPTLRKMAKTIGRNHNLAQQLWNSRIHEAQILASIIDNPKEVTEEQMESWVKDLNSWDTCDQCINNLFGKTKFAYQKAIEWSFRKEEFVKRAGFALMAHLAVHAKEAPDSQFQEFLSIVEREAKDDRNFVKKAVNWALRQIGKRDLHMNKLAIETAKEIQNLDSRSARWIASNALRELTSEAIQEKLQPKK